MRINSAYNQLKALSHIRAIFCKLHAGCSYHTPLIEKVDWNEAWAEVERAIHDMHIIMLARYDDGYRARQEVMAQGRGGVRQEAGYPLTGSAGATVSIFVVRDSEARQLRAELGGYSFIPCIARPWSQRTT